MVMSTLLPQGRLLLAATAAAEPGAGPTAWELPLCWQLAPAALHLLLAGQLWPGSGLPLREQLVHLAERLLPHRVLRAFQACLSSIARSSSASPWRLSKTHAFVDVHSAVRSHNMSIGISMRFPSGFALELTSSSSVCDGLMLKLQSALNLESMDEIKEVVTRTLERRGVLAQLKAQLRAHVFAAIDEEEVKTSGKGIVLAGLVKEFLSWSHLAQTGKVFLHSIHASIAHTSSSSRWPLHCKATELSRLAQAASGTCCPRWSMQVYDVEVDCKQMPSREQLRDELGLEREHDEPLLLSLLRIHLAGGRASPRFSSGAVTRKNGAMPAKPGGHIVNIPATGMHGSPHSGDSIKAQHGGRPVSPDTVEQAAAAAAVLHGPGHSKAQDAAKAHPAPAAASKASGLGPGLGRPMEHLTGAELAARELRPTISGGSAISEDIEIEYEEEGAEAGPPYGKLAGPSGQQDVEGAGRQTGLQSPGSPASSNNLLSPGASPSDNLVHPEHMGLSVNVPLLANRAAAAAVGFGAADFWPGWAAALANVSCGRHCSCLPYAPKGASLEKDLSLKIPEPVNRGSFSHQGQLLSPEPSANSSTNYDADSPSRDSLDSPLAPTSHEVTSSLRGGRMALPEVGLLRPASKLAPLGAKPTLAPLGGGSIQRKTPDQVAQELKQQACTTFCQLCPALAVSYAAHACSPAISSFVRSTDLGLIPQAQSKKPVSDSMQAVVRDANVFAAAGAEHVSLSFEADDLSSSDFSGHLTDHADIIEDAQEAQWP
eukprot:jgi/Astpho2/3471/fgenesh1_pg.00055_%23_32_t